MLLKILTSAALVALATLLVGPRAQASVPRCAIASLSVRHAQDVSPTTGANPLALRFVNRGASACMLEGYPIVVLRDASGVIPFVYRHRGDVMVTPRAPRPVQLRVGGSGYVLLDKFRCDVGDRRVSKSVQIGLNGSSSRSRQLSVHAHIALCEPGIAAEGRIVNVSPFEPTLRATLHG